VIGGEGVSDCVEVTAYWSAIAVAFLLVCIHTIDILIKTSDGARLLGAREQR